MLQPAVSASAALREMLPDLGASTPVVDIFEVLSYLLAFFVRVRHCRHCLVGIA